MEYLWNRWSLITILLITISLTSCKTTKNLPVKRRLLENISEGKLLRVIADNELDFKSIYSKKIDFSLKSDNKCRNFKGSLRMQRDSFIWVNLTASMGVNVGRLILTQDSVKFINTYNKEYFRCDYSYFLEKFDINLSFDYIQRMLSNHFFNFEMCIYPYDNRVRKYKLDSSGDQYILYTLEERAVNRKLKKLYKKKRKNKEFSLIREEICIDPDIFRTSLISVKDLDDNSGFSVAYKRFKDFEGKIFPEIMTFNLFLGSNITRLDIKFEKIEFDIPVEPTFKIPSKYKRIEFNE